MLWHTEDRDAQECLRFVVENDCATGVTRLSASQPVLVEQQRNSYLYRSAYWYGFLVRYDYDHNETEVGNDMYDFLQQWLDAHDEM